MADDLSSRSLFLTVLEAVSMIVLNVLSLVGNIFVCISVYRNARLRTTTNLYIIALAISDLLSAIFVMPLTAGVLVTGRWPFGKTLCQMNSVLSVFVVYVSPVTMGLTALNRYVRICKSDQMYKRFFSQRKSRFLLAVGWSFVALYLVFARLTGSQEVYFEPGYALCLNKRLSSSGRVIRFVMMVGFFFALPLAITIFSYRKIVKKIHQHNVEAADTFHQQTRVPGISTHEIRISRSLFVVVFAFILCWLPLWIISILTRLRVVGRMPRNLELLCTFCLSLSNTINPFIYAGMNPLFRNAFRRILRCESHNSIQAIPQVSSERPITLSGRARAKTVDSDYQRAISQEGVRRQDGHNKSKGSNEIELK